MGHYDDQYAADARIEERRKRKYLLDQVHENYFDCVIDAASIAASPTVMVRTQDFARMLDILRDLDPNFYSNR